MDKVKDRDIYLEHVQSEGQEREDDDVNDFQLTFIRIDWSNF